MRNRKSRRKAVSEINVVPYIDVMLVLLLIFMITTPLLSQGVDVDLPQAAAETISSQEREPIVVSVDANGQYFLNISSTPGEPIAPQALMEQISGELQKMAQSNQKQQILVKGDRSVDYGQIMQAMVLLQKAGAASVGLVTTPAEQ
jgi:biopolymer transport protein TolR